MDYGLYICGIKFKKMETTVVDQKSKSFAILISVSTVFGVLALIFLTLHLWPTGIAEALSEFAKHHYFLAGFISLCIALTVLKIYLDRTVITKQRANGQPTQILRRTKRRKLKVIYQNIKRSIDHSTAETDSIFISKEDIVNLKLRVNEVLSNARDRELRWNDLQTALRLGNLYKQKVIICFYDGVIRKHTLATIWHLDNEHVSIKGGAVLPVKNIYKIEL